MLLANGGVKVCLCVSLFHANDVSQLLIFGGAGAVVVWFLRRVRIRMCAQRHEKQSTPQTQSQTKMQTQMRTLTEVQTQREGGDPNAQDLARWHFSRVVRVWLSKDAVTGPQLAAANSVKEALGVFAGWVISMLLCSGIAVLLDLLVESTRLCCGHVVAARVRESISQCLRAIGRAVGLAMLWASAFFLVCVVACVTRWNLLLVERGAPDWALLFLNCLLLSGVPPMLTDLIGNSTRNARDSEYVLAFAACFAPLAAVWTYAWFCTTREFGAFGRLELVDAKAICIPSWRA